MFAYINICRVTCQGVLAAFFGDPPRPDSCSSVRRQSGFAGKIPPCQQTESTRRPLQARNSSIVFLDFSPEWGLLLHSYICWKSEAGNREKYIRLQLI